ncbi:hypothetical protein OAS39_00435 [Pirellulales bacterium]|nr:hypothetical protein [Pirellulales bacterium]
MLAHRLFVGAVLALWVGSMSWLVIEKILPSFGRGEPPIAAGMEIDVPVAWSVAWSDEHVGHAASVRRQGIQHTTEIRSRVRLDDVPVLDLAPVWMRDVVGDIGKLRLDATTRMEFDSLDNFSAFESSVAVNELPGILKMSGRVKDSYLDLKIRSGEVTYSPTVYIADHAALNEALFPDATLPHLYLGRRWQRKTYNPFRSPGDPVELVEAIVVADENIEYEFDEELRRVWRVEFRSAAGPGVSREARLHAISWVEPTGLVLRQDVYISGARLRFERLPPEEAMTVGEKLLSDHPGSRRLPGLRLPKSRPSPAASKRPAA